MPLRHIEKSPQFSGPFAVPSTPLFEDFCKDLVHRYCLEDAVIRDKVSMPASAVMLVQLRVQKLHT